MGLGNSRKAAHLLGSPGRKRMKTALNAKNFNHFREVRGCNMKTGMSNMFLCFISRWTFVIAQLCIKLSRGKEEMKGTGQKSTTKDNGG